MAKEDERDRLRRRWGDDDEENTSATSPALGGGQATITSEKLDQMISQADVFIEQINNLFTQFLAGIEKFPPNEKRKQLETLVQQITQVAKPNATARFKTQGLVSKYMTAKDRWERTLRDLESGKIQRRIGGK